MDTVTLCLKREDASEPAASDAVALQHLVEALAVGLALNARSPDLRAVAQALYSGRTVDVSFDTSPELLQ
ncbi:MAG: hypothetical protein ACYS7M_15285 [Planctomycetota bacterium]|jgi:hypothetical protein